MANLYYQFRKDVNDNALSAYLFSLEANHHLNSTWSLNIGVEIISGNDNGSSSNVKTRLFLLFMVPTINLTV
ncbi:hypothetical protein [Maribacter sp. 1_MG-2023]|uniref:hypothetical protein n=1 Tax=Maribacter sp. 1_MG-2023 TaxID=3062677 RepID=UPI0026E38B02|nr:hypothetical protein [Maribacter sp. 1_MG-2023]MDO6472568.1 hypothetical protein [Maribacter sp. 1_MG-2023]